MTLIGRSVRRIEDRPLLTGRGQFIGDLSLPGQIHMRIVRSPIAFGRIAGVECAEAAEMPGVVAIWTGRDLAELPPIDFRRATFTELKPYRQPVLARDLVRYVGEPVAAVFAEDEYAAEDAAERVFVDVDAMEAFLDPEDTPVAFDPNHTNEATRLHQTYGDVEGAFRLSADVIELELRVGRHSGVPMETRGGLAVYDKSTDLLELYGAAQIPHFNRAALSSMLDLPKERIILHEGCVGGGFGVRGCLYPEDVLLCLAALRLAHPVKWIEDRREHLVSANHSRDQIHLIKGAIDDDGVITAIVDEFWQDQGAYIRTHGTTVAEYTAAMLPGPYVVPAFEVTGHVMLTNKTPAGTYRAPGRFEGTFVRERLIDAIAERTGRDPMEIRRVNLISAEQMPFTRPLTAVGLGVVYDSGDYAKLLDRMLTHIEYEQLREELATRRAAGEFVGLGFGFFVERSGGSFEGVRVSLGESGEIHAVTGATSMGQGMETVIAQVCAETLGTAVSNVRVIHGDTNAISDGAGAFGSRVTMIAGSAAQAAASAVRGKVLDIAAGMLAAQATDLEISDGWVRRVGAGASRAVTLAEVAREAATTVSKGDETGLSSESWFDNRDIAYPYGAAAAVAQVDPATGAVEISRFVVAYDVGRAINPMLVEGQLVGGAIQGIAGALLENFVYDENGQPLATTLSDYLLPTASESPRVEVLISEDAPSPLNPLGAKGAGEGGTTGCGAAVAAAIEDAVGRPGAITQLPITPERLRVLLG